MHEYESEAVLLVPAFVVLSALRKLTVAQRNRHRKWPSLVV